MKENIQSINPVYSLLPIEITDFDLLAELALDMRLSWNHMADKLWQQLDPGLWELTHSPWVILQTISGDHIGKMLKDKDFHAQVDELVQYRRQALESGRWFQQNFPQSELTCVAYFSMEYMLSEALPIYSGGLGNVAGDQLKAACDLGVPVVGVGLLYQQGYFRQIIDNDGEQHALYSFNNPGQLPVTPVRQSNGEWLRLKINLPGYVVWFRAWQVQIGKVRLYLLDTNDMANPPIHQGITSELYGGGPETRIKQELLLGIGGWRLLEALGIRPEVCHLNEGHAAFAVLERAYSYMQENGQSFEVALAVTRAGNLFTTHTALAAGFDRFSPFLIEQYLGHYAQSDLGISMQDLLALGRLNRNDTSEMFNMAYLAIRGSGSVNAVSKLHEKVSRQLFSPLFPHWPEDEIPVGHITNGVHIPSWESPVAEKLWTRAGNKDNWLGMSETPEVDINKVSDEEIWKMRNASRRLLIDYARQKLSLQLEASGASPENIESAKLLFSPDILTLGFARRFVSYKRPNLLLHDTMRLLDIIKNSERPVQLIIAGKAHPADEEGQSMIHEWFQFIQQPDVRPHIMFLSDYDMLMTQHLVEGVDVWINTPRRPWEASGTSGMKILVNGGLNLSELDGWWAEAYSPEVGWAIGDGEEHEDINEWDKREAYALYDVLENEVVRSFYKRDKNNLPGEWINKVRESMAQLTPRFSATRTVREYTEKHYVKSAEAFKERSSAQSSKGLKIVEWEHLLAEKWPKVSFGKINVDAKSGNYSFDVQVNLHQLSPENVSVELYAEGTEKLPPFIQEMTLAEQISKEDNSYNYHTEVKASFPSGNYTARIIPLRNGIGVPLEMNKILWQH